MKRVNRIVGLILSFSLLLSATVFAANIQIDVSTVSDGYFSVYYDGSTGVKMKVGVTFSGKTSYYDYTPGTTASYALEKGDGKYVISLYRNTSGISYRKVTGKSVSVTLKNALVPYLASTTEITFKSGDGISKKAAELCEGLSSNESKVVVIHNYIAKNFGYDYEFAALVRKGKIKTYTPDTNQVLKDKMGVCYDFSAVFAAMCRSQGIPCSMVKGYAGGGYHAWNRVYLDGEWLTVDMTDSVAKRTTWTKVPR